MINIINEANKATVPQHVRLFEVGCIVKLTTSSDHYMVLQNPVLTSKSLRFGDSSIYLWCLGDQTLHKVEPSTTVILVDDKPTLTYEGI